MQIIICKFRLIKMIYKQLMNKNSLILWWLDTKKTWHDENRYGQSTGPTQFYVGCL